MKTQLDTQKYFSTSQAAKRLGFAIGTVKKMVETGMLSAYITPGGHRRILSTSLNEFCGQRGIEDESMQAENHLVCIMHSQAHARSELALLSQWPNVKVIFNPLHLIGMQQAISTLFIDARIPWLDWSTFHLGDQLAKQAQFVVYNSFALPANSLLKYAPNVSLFEGDINSHLIFGYLLRGTHSWAASSSVRFLPDPQIDLPKFSSASSNKLKNALSMNGNRMSKPASPAVKVTGKPTA